MSHANPPQNPSARPLHVALIIEHYDPRVGGAERSAAQIVQALLDRGHRVTVLTGQCPDAEELERPGLSVCMPVTGRPRGLVRLAAFAGWVRRQLDVPGRFDTSLSLTTLVPAAVVQPRAGLVIQSQHRNIARRAMPLARVAKTVEIALSPRRQLMRLLERMTLRDGRVQRLVAISRYMAEGFQRYYSVDADRIDLIPNAAEMPTVTQGQREQWREQVRRGFLIGEDRLVFLFPAIDPWRKGLEPLMHAMKRLVDRGQPVVLMLAGSAGYGQQKLAAELGIRDHVRIVGTTRQMHTLYCAADVTVLPTFHDPASKVVIESLMLGTPAISTAYNGASDLIAGPGIAEPRGRVIDNPADVDALTAAMTDLLDPQARQRCAEATRGLAEQLTMARHVEQLEGVLAATAGLGEAQAPTDELAPAASQSEVRSLP